MNHMLLYDVTCTQLHSEVELEVGIRMTRLTKALAYSVLLLGSWLALVLELVPIKLPAEIREVVIPVSALENCSCASSAS